MPLSEGEQFAGYTMVRLLGSGGMGEVYLARHPRFPRFEALKVLHADLSADPDFQQRFNREAELAAGLWHPHIVGVHDRGEFDGQLWITMDYVDGADLGELMSTRYRTGMPPDQVVAVVSAVADALDHAHRQGLLHRDVKPANIIVSQPGDGSAPRILLSDFGIARPIDDTTGLTATNMALGTVNYSSPEQLMGAPLDGRSDQYSLAATAYYLLTGLKMFSNLPAVAVISAHLTAPPPVPGAVRRELAPADAVFARALAKDPRHRFQRCSDFATALAAQLRVAPHPQAPSAPPRGVSPYPGPAPAGYQGWPAPPPAQRQESAPKGRRRALRVAAVAATVIVVAAVVGYFAIARDSGGKSAHGGGQAPDAARLAAQRYLEALSRGDAAAALSMSANAPAATQWVSADALRAQLSSSPITDIAVTSAPSAPGDDPNSVQYVMLSARFGATLSQARIAMRRNGNDWKLDTATVPVNIGTPGVSNASSKAVALFGIPTDGASPVPIFPGALVVSSANRFVDITAQAPPVLLNALSGGGSPAAIQPVVTLNDSGREAAKAAVDNWEHYCYQGVAPPPECQVLSNSDNTVSVVGVGDFSKAQFSFDPNTMQVALSGSVVYFAHSKTTATVTYNAAGTVDLTKDPPTYAPPGAHR
jgi:hypothetical protein